MGGTSVTGSMVGLRSLIGSNSTIEEALIMGADYYETLEECALVAECIPMGIGSNTTLRKCIIDKNARIGSNVQIVNAAGVQEANHEEEGYIIKGDRRRRQGRRHLGRHDHLMTGGPVLLDSGSR